MAIFRILVAGVGVVMVYNAVAPNIPAPHIWDPNFGSASMSTSGFPLGNGYVFTWAELVQVILGLFLIYLAVAHIK